MVPSEYRLERVAAALVERLDAARRSWADLAAVQTGSLALVDELVASAMSEWVGLGFAEASERQGELLRRELSGTLVPRIVPLLHQQNEAERRGFGLGPLAEPLGRVLMVVASLLFFGVVLVRFERNPIDWVLTLLTFAAPFLPDVLRELQGRRYQGAVSAALVDMKRIQDEALRYQASEPVAAPGARPRPQAQRTGADG